MSKTEIVKSLAQQRSKAISAQINELRQLQTSSVESLAQQIEPLAQALAALSEEGRKTIIKSVNYSTKKHSAAREELENQTGELVKERQRLNKLNSSLQESISQISRQRRSVSLKVWIAAISTSVILALALVSAYAIWQPPLSQNEKAAIKYYNAIAPEHQQQIIETVKRNNL